MVIPISLFIFVGCMNHTDWNKAAQGQDGTTHPSTTFTHLASMILMFLLGGAREIISSFILSANLGNIVTRFVKGVFHMHPILGRL